MNLHKSLLGAFLVVSAGMACAAGSPATQAFLGV